MSWRFLHGRPDLPPPALEAYLRELFLYSPFSDSTFPSLVYQDDRGEVAGFLGVLPRRMLLRNRPIQAAFGAGLVVHPDSRSTMAGIQLLDSFISGEQDLSMTDTANALGQKIWLTLGGSTALLYAMHWSRPIRPGRYAAYALERLTRNRLSTVLSVASRPVCRVMDAVVTRLPGPFRRRAPAMSGEALDLETLRACFAEVTKTQSLRADYDSDSLSWLLDFMGRMHAYGDLRKVVLRDKQRNAVGWYIYYVNEGGVGEVVQVGAVRSPISMVLDHLFYDAWTHGVIALHGRLDPQLTEELSERQCFFYLNNRLLVHSRKPELVRLIQDGSAYLTRLDGEWCLRFGDSRSQAGPGATEQRLSAMEPTYAA